jgi:hypothetical protein
MFVARLELVRLKRTIFNERVCSAIKSGPSKKKTFFRSVFVALLEVARLKQTIFNEHICGAIKSGASKVNYFPRACLWLFQCLQRPTVACTRNYTNSESSRQISFLNSWRKLGIFCEKFLQASSCPFVLISAPSNGRT